MATVTTRDPITFIVPESTRTVAGGNTSIDLTCASASAYELILPMDGISSETDSSFVKVVPSQLAWAWVQLQANGPLTGELTYEFYINGEPTVPPSLTFPDESAEDAMLGVTFTAANRNSTPSRIEVRMIPGDGQVASGNSVVTLAFLPV